MKRINKSQVLEALLKSAESKVDVDVCTCTIRYYRHQRIYCRLRYDPKNEQIRLNFGDYAGDMNFNGKLFMGSPASKRSYRQYVNYPSSEEYVYNLSEIKGAISRARRKGIKVKKLYDAVKRKTLEGVK